MLMLISFEVTTVDSQELECMRNPEWLEQLEQAEIGRKLVLYPNAKSIMH